MRVFVRHGSAEQAEATAVAGGPIRFETEGFRIEGSRRRKRFVRYEDVTHVAPSTRGLGIGTLDNAVLLRRRAFADEDALMATGHAILDRIAGQPGGALQLSRMAEIDGLAGERPRRRVILAFTALCVAIFVLQLRDPFLSRVGSFIPGLFSHGEFWRLVTANFLHEPLLFPLHIGLNLLCVLAIGQLVERVLGSVRTVIVMGVSAIGAMVGCVFGGYSEVVGASGVVAGLAGALLCLELKGSRRLPVWWRIPRRFFIGALLLQACFDLLLPFVAGAAHAGGFIAGYLATRIFVGDSLLRRPAGRMAWVAAAVTVSGLLLSAAAVGPLARHEPNALESHALRLLHSRAGSAIHDNDVAWMLVTETEPSFVRLHTAAALAERAVERTQRSNPDLLDTLAETLFLLGDATGALGVIDEALAIARGDRYLEEQRRRFTGERAAEDRPEAPTLPWMLRGPDAGTPVPELIDPGQPGLSI
jgi:membrane associated rhomboid family serine protease